MDAEISVEIDRRPAHGYAHSDCWLWPVNIAAFTNSQYARPVFSCAVLDLALAHNLRDRRHLCNYSIAAGADLRIPHVFIWASRSLSQFGQL